MIDMGRHLYEKWLAHQAKQNVECDPWDELEETDKEAWRMLGDDMLAGGYRP